MKVLIVKVSALGDIVHALPVLAYLDGLNQDLSVDWLLEKSFAPLLENHPMLRNVITLDTKRWRKAGFFPSIREVLKVVGQLRKEKYDVVLDLQGNSKSGLFTWLSGAPKRYGFDRQQAREILNLASTNHKVDIPADCHHISKRYLRIVQSAFPSSQKVPLCGPLSVDPAAEKNVLEQLKEYGLKPNEYFVAHYGTTWETKLWPLQQWKELIKVLTEQGQNIILTWGNDKEREAVEAIIAKASQGRALIWPKKPLAELIALLRLARLVIGADTGPVHIAAAVGTSTVSLFRVTDSERNGPPGENHIRLQAQMDCSPCLRKQCDLNEQCGESITVDAVVDAVGRLMIKDQK